ncbi:hypothetical protein BDR05DRAFT_944885 [Suillus weaverae]|nr:hypothetical protein BDR05DRAFT_944885 [Suillus weaverae]
MSHSQFHVLTIQYFAMAGKRKCDGQGKQILSSDELQKILLESVTTHKSAEMALLFLMEEHNFSIHLLYQAIANSGQRLKISFSKVEFQDIVPFVGLDHHRLTNDITTFPLHRSRIPTSLFKSIVEDIDMMMLQYGPPIDHETEEARSRFLSPLQGAFRNKPEGMIPGRIASQGRIEYYFNIFGAVATVFIEIKKRIGDTGITRLDAIAQVIAECDACDWVNAQSDFCVPIHAILCDGELFEFYQFTRNGSRPHTFSRGTYCSERPPYATMHRLRLPDLADSDNSLSFITALRPICEVIFDLFLQGYCSTVAAHHGRSTQTPGTDAVGSQPNGTLELWKDSYTQAVIAKEGFREANELCMKGQANQAKSAVELAMQSLEKR